MKKLAINTQNGRMSTFGGPDDTGVTSSEGLALMTKKDIGSEKFGYLFLPKQPPRTTGLARRLDPSKYYIAMRWDYKKTSLDALRSHKVKLTANGITIEAQPVDWGPNANTRRIADLSPGAAKALKLITDNDVMVFAAKRGGDRKIVFSGVKVEVVEG